MLLVVMHNNDEYIDRVTQLAESEDIKDFTVVEGKDIGLRLIGGTANFVFSTGKVIDAYEKAFVAVVKGRKVLKHFLNVLEHDSRLEILNLQTRGFVCAVPFHYIMSLKFESPERKKKITETEIANFLQTDRILLDMKSSNKKEAIEELAYLLENAEEISDFDAFINDVFKRESLITTGIGNYVAIPHARTDAVNDIVVAFGRSLGGIEFDALDKKPAKFVILIGTPKSKGLNIYLRILAHVTRLLKKQDFQKLILAASNPEEIIEEFRKRTTE